jgi:two-component sensor histidine kinase
MLALLKATSRFPLWVRVAITGFALCAAYIFQIPLETQVPGEPFLLFFAVLIACTLVFGRNSGFVAVAASSILSLHFFEPGGSVAIYHAADLIKVEIYAVFSAAAVVVMARLNQALIAAGQASQLLGNLEKQQSVLLAELAHRVANNFATIAALIRQKSISVADPQAKWALEETIVQVGVMARIHGRLCIGDKNAFFDSQTFLQELCEDIGASVGSLRPLSIECAAISHSLPVADAVPLGLIVNELITNAIKYAFPDGRAGTITASLDKFGDQLRLTVQDDGVGLRGSVQGTGIGHRLVHALAQQLGANIAIRSDGRGTVISITFDADKRLNGPVRNIELGAGGAGNPRLETGFAHSTLAIQRVRMARMPGGPSSP